MSNSVSRFQPFCLAIFDKVDTDDLLQVKKFHRTRSLTIWLLCKRSGLQMDNVFSLTVV